MIFLKKQNEEFKARSQFSQVMHRLMKNKLAMLGLAILLFMIAIATGADFIADYETEVIGQNMAERLQGPSAEHWFGTDQFGRDVFARIVHGARISFDYEYYCYDYRSRHRIDYWCYRRIFRRLP